MYISPPHVFTHAPFARNSIYSVVTQRDHEYDLNNCQGILSSVLYTFRSFVSRKIIELFENHGIANRKLYC